MLSLLMAAYEKAPKKGVTKKTSTKRAKSNTATAPWHKNKKHDKG